MMNIMPYLPQECWPTDVVFAGYEDDILVVKDDGSNYYVPAFGVQTLAEMCPDEGYSVFLNGAGAQLMSVDGLPSMDMSLTLDPFRMNLLPYSPQDCMPTDAVFAGYEESLLIVKNDDSDYYVPAYGVETLQEMCPGESYAVFLNGASGLDVTYPMGGALA